MSLCTVSSTYSNALRRSTAKVTPVSVRLLWLLYSPAAVVPAHLSPLSDLPEASDLMLSRTADGLMMLTAARLPRKKKKAPVFLGAEMGARRASPRGGRGLHLSVLIGGSEICPLGVFS